MKQLTLWVGIPVFLFWLIDGVNLLVSHPVDGIDLYDFTVMAVLILLIGFVRVLWAIFPEPLS